MRKELKTIELIEKYLTNQLTEKEKTAFEKAIKSNSKLKEQVEAQKAIMKTAQRVGLKKSTQRSHKKWKVKKGITKGGVALAVTTVIVALGMYFYTNNTESTTPNFDASFTTQDSISNFSNTQLEKEVYQINTSTDTIIETKDGVVFYIPENAFNTNNKNVELVVQTAINPEDILMAGLSTTSNGNPLETGGMFYVDAYVNGQRVELNKSLTVDVPKDEKKSDMQLYKGEKTENGEINWVAPKKIETFLTPVDILSLDFYPPNYEDSLDNWGTYDKAFKDSLYYSFVFENYLGELSFEENQFELKEGELLFKANCASCHKVDKNSTGPMLKGARERWRNAGESNLIYEWIHDPVGLAESGRSKRALEIINFSKSQMTPQSLTERQMKLVLKFADGSLMPNCVNPSTVKTIWDTKFNNTILATKEFEERMPYIHNSCSNEVLETYINNLDKSLSEIDSMVLPLVSGGVKDQFIQFAQHGDGKVELSTKAAQRLAGYYKRKQKMIAKALAKTQQDYWNKQVELDNKLNNKELESKNRNNQNTGEVFMKEYKKNLCKVYAEVNYPYNCEQPFRPITPKYTVEVSNLGWNNIDRKVYEATATRTSTTISYNGKSSTLTYNDWSATVKNEEKFDRVFVYNIPVEFNSYIKLPKVEKQYSYKLNADINYNTVVIGWTENQMFYAKEVSKQGHSTFDLQQIEEKELKKLLKKELGNNEKSKAESDFISYAHQDQKRINKNEKALNLKAKIEPIIFPCWYEPITSGPAVPIADSTSIP